MTLAAFHVDALAQAASGNAGLPLIIGQGAGGTSYSVPIQTLLFFTALSFLPAVLLPMTGFTRIASPFHQLAVVVFDEVALASLHDDMTFRFQAIHQVRDAARILRIQPTVGLQRAPIGRARRSAARDRVLTA